MSLKESNSRHSDASVSGKREASCFVDPRWDVGVERFEKCDAAKLCGGPFHVGQAWGIVSTLILLLTRWCWQADRHSLFFDHLSEELSWMWQAKIMFWHVVRLCCKIYRWLYTGSRNWILFWLYSSYFSAQFIYFMILSQDCQPIERLMNFWTICTANGSLIDFTISRCS